MKSKLNIHRITSHASIISLGVIVLFAWISNLIWIHSETRPPHWDMGRHLWTGLAYFDNLSTGHIARLLLSYFYYPPLVYWNSLPFIALLGKTPFSAVASNITFIVIFVLGLYMLGRELWGKNTGIMAAILGVSTPMLVSQFKEFQVDAPLAAMSIFALALLVMSRNFTRRNISVWLGIFIGMGFLTKWTFGLVFFLPLAVAVGHALYLDFREKSYNRILNMIIVAALASLLAAPWYLHNHHQLLIDLNQNASAAGIAEGDPAIGTAASNEWYFWNLISNQLYLIPFLLFVAGFIISVTKLSNLKKNLYPLLLFAGTILAFTMLRNKDARYTLPAIGAVSLLATFWIFLLPKLWRNILAGLVIVYSIAAFLMISFGTNLLPKTVGFAFDTYGITAFAQHGYIIGPPTKERWRQEDAMKLVINNGGRGKFVLYSALDTMWFNGWGMQYYSVKYATPLTQDPAIAKYEIWRGFGAAPSGNVLGKYTLPDRSVLVVLRLH